MKQFAFALLLGLSTHAQQGKWEHEPNSFINISLDKPLSDSAESCPTVTVGRITMPDEGSTNDPCYIQPTEGSKQFLVYHEKGFYSVLVKEVAGRVGLVSTIVSADSQPFYEKALTAKFGVPSTSVDTTVSTLGGAVVTQRTLTWTGNNVIVTFQSPTSDVDSAVIYATTEAYRKDLADGQAKAALNKARQF